MATERQRLLSGSPAFLILAVVLGLGACGGGPIVVYSAFDRGIERQDAGDLRGAEEEYQNALVDHPEDFRIHYNLGLVYDAQARRSVRDGDGQAALWVEKALASYERVLVLQPGNPRALVAKAMLLAEQGREAEAIELLAAEDGSPDHADDKSFGSALPQWALGNLHRRAGRAAEAEAAYRKALAADENHVESSTSLANLLIDQNRLEEAETVIRKGLEAHDFDFTLRRLHAQVAVIRARDDLQNGGPGLEEARRRLLLAHSIQGDNWQVNEWLGEVAIGLAAGTDDREEQRRRLEEAVERTWIARDSLSPAAAEDEGVRFAEHRARMDARLQELYSRLVALR